MQELIESIEEIIQKTQLSKTTNLKRLLMNCLYIGDESLKSTYAQSDDIVFRQKDFFKGLNLVMNETPKGDRLITGVSILYTLFSEFELEMDKSDCFVLYHLKDLDKFRLREANLYSELVKSWLTHKDYLLSEADYYTSLKYLRKLKFVKYRQRNLSLNPIVVFQGV